MTYSSIVISSGHSTRCQGAVGPSPWGLNEVAEATRVVDTLATELRLRGVTVVTYHDTVSTSQDENLNRIVDFHNSKSRQLDVSCHFNASSVTNDPRGCEVYYYSKNEPARTLSAAIAKSGFKDRGPKQNQGLFFLAHTEALAVLLEICFVDSKADVEIYHASFDRICRDLADVLGGSEAVVEPPEEVSAAFHTTGRCSYFGGPDDQGVSPSEGLAFHSSVNDGNQQLFLPMQPGGTTGLARRLNPAVDYVACRWDYSVTPKSMLASRENIALVRSTRTGIAVKAFPADWGPHEDTGRVADLSPSLIDALGIATDDEVEVIYPYQED